MVRAGVGDRRVVDVEQAVVVVLAINTANGQSRLPVQESGLVRLEK